MTKERDTARRHRAIAVLVPVVLMLVAAMPATATTPGPVIPVGDAPGGSEPAPAEPGPEDAGPEDVADCLLGWSGAASTLVAYPAPVIPVPSVERESSCRTEISLSLEVRSPDERRPDGADADVDGTTAPRPALEAGFDTTLPARSRTWAVPAAAARQQHS